MFVVAPFLYFTVITFIFYDVIFYWPFVFYFKDLLKVH